MNFGKAGCPYFSVVIYQVIHVLASQRCLYFSIYYAIQMGLYISTHQVIQKGSTSTLILLHTQGKYLYCKCVKVSQVLFPKKNLRTKTHSIDPSLIPSARH